MAVQRSHKKGGAPPSTGVCVFNTLGTSRQPGPRKGYGLQGKANHDGLGQREQERILGRGKSVLWAWAGRLAKDPRRSEDLRPKRELNKCNLIDFLQAFSTETGGWGRLGRRWRWAPTRSD